MAGGSSEVAASRNPYTRDNNLSSSVHKVLSNDDILMEILLRLPILSLHLFKPVCKQWLSLITSPSFTLRVRTRIPTVDPPSGLFIGRDPSEYDFVSFDPRIPTKRSILFPFNLEGGIERSFFFRKAGIEQSCNGLLLCYDGDGNYIIYNPLINLFKMLPPIHYLNYDRSSIDYIYLAFDPTKSPCYKVVHVGSSDDDHGVPHSIIIQIYSSETGVWRDDRFPSYSFEDFVDGIYWNGAIHWLSYREPFHVKLDILDCPVLTNIQTPFPHCKDCNRKFFKSHGSLLLLCKDYAPSRNLNIYEMKTGSSEWSVKYFVNLDDMMRPYPTWRMPDDWYCYHIWSIVVGERDVDSFMVFELFEKVLQYSFLLGTVSEIFDLGQGINGCTCIDYVASFAHV